MQNLKFFLDKTTDISFIIHDIETLFRITKQKKGKRMNDGITVFISGIAGVACGMTLLYLSIKITAKVTDFIQQKKEAGNA